MNVTLNGEGYNFIPFIHVHSDARRSIFANDELLKDKKEISFIKLNKGKAIGGCIHDKNEYMCVIDGEVLVLLGDKRFMMGRGHSICIPANTPHTFMSAEEALIMEWGITAEEKQLGAKGKDQTHTEFIKRVNGTDS